MSGLRDVRAPVAAALVAVAALAAAAAASPATPPELISRASDGAPANGSSAFPSTSADGRYVAFRSEATNLVPEDTDDQRDVYVRDRRTGAVTLVSRASGPSGAKGNRHSFNPRISADGRYVAFRSNANNFVPEDSDQLEDVYVRDLQTAETILVSRASTAAGPKGNGGSFNPSISADGRRVAFRSEATNLSPEDPDPVPDIYVRDLQTAETILVSRATGPAGPKGTAFSEFPVLSGDGRRVAFRSESPNLDPADPDPIEDIFVRDLQTAETILVSRAAGGGAKGDGRSTFVSISHDGTVVAFDSLSTNLHPDDSDASADVFARHLDTGELELASRADGERGAKGLGSAEPSISADGSVVAFHSTARNLVPEDTDALEDVYVRDLDIYDTSVLSRGFTSGPAGRSLEPWISADGKLVAFQSAADDLGTEDLPGVADIFAARVPAPARCLGRRVTAMAAAGTLTRGTAGADVVVGGAGDEQIKLGGGRDRVCAGEGDDLVVAGGDRDLVQAGGGADRVSGSSGSDRLLGNGGRDGLDGGSGRDVCRGGGGKDRLKRCEGGAD